MSSPSVPPTRVRHAVTMWLAAAAVFAYLCRNSLMVAESGLRADLGLTEEQMGFILGPAFFWTYALAQIPTAWLGERFGSRRCLPAFSTAWSLANVMIALATGFGWLLVGRLASGIAQAGLFPSSVRTISEWNPQSGRATASGILGAAMSVGGAIGAGLTGWLLGFLTATTIFMLFALPGLVWAVGFRIWFRNRPSEHPSVNAAERAFIAGRVADGRPDDADDVRRDGVNGDQACGDQDTDAKLPRPQATARPGGARMWSELATSPAAWLLFGQQFFRAGGYAFFASWFATYLMETRGVSTMQSGWLAALPLVATVIGSMLGGYVSDAVFKATGSLGWGRKGVAVGSLALCASLVFSAFFVADPTKAVLVISSGAFFAAVAGPCGYTMTMDMGGSNVASVFSTMNMMGNFGAGLTPWLVPQFKRWVESSPTLLAYCDGNSWNAVLLLFVGMYIGSAVCWSMLSAKGTVFDHSLLRRKANDDPIG